MRLDITDDGQVAAGVANVDGVSLNLARTGDRMVLRLAAMPGDLTGAVLTGKKQSIETGEVDDIDGVLSVVYPGTNGIFTWRYGDNDVAVAGEFLLQITATYPDTLIDRTMLELWAVHRAL